MENMDSDIDLFKRLRRVLNYHIAILEDPEPIFKHEEIHDEILGAFIDEEIADKNANPAYVYMALAYLDTIQTSPKSDVLSGMKTLDNVFDLLIQRHNEVIKHDGKHQI